MDKLLEIFENLLSDEKKLGLYTVIFVVITFICIVIFSIVMMLLTGQYLDGKDFSFFDSNWRQMELVIGFSLCAIAIILTYFIKIRNKHVKLEPKLQKIVDKTISDEEYITTYIKNLVKYRYPNDYEIIFGKLKNKNWFTMDDIQNIAINVRKIDEESVIDEFLLALSIEYIGEEIYALVRKQPRFAIRDWNTIISKLKREYKVKVDVKFHIEDN